MLLLYICISWFIGLWVASQTAVSLTTWLISSGACLMAAILLRRWRQGAVLLACLGVIALGAARYDTAVPTIDENHIAFYHDDTDVQLTGLVIDEPDIRDRYINLRVAAEQLELADGTTIPVAGTLLVRAFRFPDTDYGTRITAYGTIEAPPSDGEFNYADYLARQDIHSLMVFPQIEHVAEQQGHPLKYAIFAFKQRAHTTINRLVSEPNASLLAGILLGNDNGLPPELDDDFRTTGMTHIIAISGFNIAIIIIVLVGLGRPFLGQRGAVIFAMVGITFYTILVGADASVVRAAIMGSVYLLTSRWLGRPTFSVGTLFLAGFVMTAIRPFTLWDVGFQLSFAATLSLMLYADPLAKRVRKWLQHLFEWHLTEQIMGVITEAVIITIAAQILTLPLMMGHFQQLSLISLLANALILPAQPGVMLWGGLATLVGLVLPTIAQLFAWIAELFLSYTIWLVRLLASVPGASVSIEMSWAGVVVIYALIAAGTWYARQEKWRRAKVLAALRRNLTRRIAFGSSFVLLLLVVGWNITQPDGNLHIVFMDVGQGDATFIQTPSGRQILIDGGLYPSVLNDRLGQQMPFWDKEIDMLIATHPDADHVSGLVGVFERYRVGRLVTDGSVDGESDVYDAVLEAAAVAGTAVHPTIAGETIIIEDGVTLEVLHPGSTRNDENRNENSVSMRLSFGDFTYLFTGDAEQQAERQMVQRGLPLQALVLKAGHHG
ncbi:MAG: ComEC/Rec2 family competence protein, partial [Chloroflexi bacterium]|nr:ComEC/Rec2 family competence protein [Chloroflexota bacterium]